MNEKLQYATMLEMPVNTCNVTKVSSKKKKMAKPKKPTEEQVKNQLLDMVNGQNEKVDDTSQDLDEQIELNEQFQDIEDQPALEIDQQIKQDISASVNYQSDDNKKSKKPFKLTVIGVQIATVGLLVAIILLTNAIFVDSGMNVFFRSVFSSEQQVQTDSRVYSQFEPVIAMGNNQDLALSEGVISFAGEGSVYAPCDGKVVSVSKAEDGTFNVEIMHSENFKSIISGVERLFVEQGQSVYKTIPIGYLEPNGAYMRFADSDGSIITDYQLENGVVRWAV